MSKKREVVVISAAAARALDEATAATGRDRKDLASQAILTHFGSTPLAADDGESVEALTARLQAVLPGCRAAIVRLGEYRAVERDLELGGRTAIGFDAVSMDEDQVAWATAGRWTVRADLDFLAGVGAGQVQVILRTPQSGWRSSQGRAFNVSPIKLGPDLATDLVTGRSFPMLDSDRAVWSALAARHVKFPGGARNPVRRLSPERQR